MSIGNIDFIRKRPELRKHMVSYRKWQFVWWMITVNKRRIFITSHIVIYFIFFWGIDLDTSLPTSTCEFDCKEFEEEKKKDESKWQELRRRSKFSPHFFFYCCAAHVNSKHWKFLFYHSISHTRPNVLQGQISCYTLCWAKFSLHKILYEYLKLFCAIEYCFCFFF